MRRSLVEPNAEIARIDVTPVIGVALILVLVLLITAPLFPVADLGITPPLAHTRGVEQSPRITVTVGLDGAIAVDDRIVAAGELDVELGRRLRLATTDVRPPVVIVRADATSDHQVVQHVLRDVRSAGAQRVAIGTLQRIAS
jgi:biopolymer transport protein ExbD